MLVAGLVALALVAGYLGANRADQALYTPDRAVQEFFEALAHKDTAALRAAGQCRDGALCEAGALGSGYVPPAGLRIREVRYGSADGQQLARLPKRTHAAVVVTYEVGGKAFDDVVPVRRAGWFDAWSISAVPGWRVVVDGSQAPQVKIAAATVKAFPENNLGNAPVVARLWAPPGVYTVTVPGDPLFEAEPMTLTVGGREQETTLVPVVRLRDDLVAEVDRQVKARLEACAGQATVRPDTDPALLSGNDCPFSALDRYTITRGITWRITRFPRLALTPGAGRTVVVKTVAEGEAEIRYEWTTDILEPRDWQPFSEAIAFDVAGQVTVGDDGKVVWSM
jgi:hypothetical protein